MDEIVLTQSMYYAINNLLLVVVLGSNIRL